VQIDPFLAPVKGQRNPLVEQAFPIHALMHPGLA
jgi:hypothetical protein